MASGAGPDETDADRSGWGSDGGAAAAIPEVRQEERLLRAGALQNAILSSANFSSIATDERGVIQLFNVGA